MRYPKLAPQALELCVDTEGPQVSWLDYFGFKFVRTEYADLLGRHTVLFDDGWSVTHLQPVTEQVRVAA